MADNSLEAFEQEAGVPSTGTRPARGERTFVWGQGSDKVTLFDEKARDAAGGAGQGQEWRATKFDGGFGWVSGPSGLRRRELSQAHERLWASLEGRYDVPNQSFFGIGLGMVAPTILAHATDTAKDLYLRRLYRGEARGLPALLEPGAGSDLASLQTKAERDGDEWLITGQKVWTSGAQYSDIGEIICRTDPDLPKHKGLTGFIVDMRAPGVEIRPLRQMTGGASFNEVFFNEVRVRDDHRLGDRQPGLVGGADDPHERAGVDRRRGAVAHRGGMTPRIIEMVRHFGLDTDPIVRNELAALVSLPAGGQLHETSGRWTRSSGSAARARSSPSPSSP
jgi:acyl-CoA dehydrogenase